MFKQFTILYFLSCFPTRRLKLDVIIFCKYWSVLYVAHASYILKYSRTGLVEVLALCSSSCVMSSMLLTRSFSDGDIEMVSDSDSEPDSAFNTGVPEPCLHSSVTFSTELRI